MANARPLLILGKTGTLGAAFARICGERGIPYRLWERSDLDLARPGDMAAKIRALAPWAVVNATGYVRVNDAEGEPERCHLVNCTGAVALAEACAKLDLPLLSFSSDLVFDGSKGTSYKEYDRPAPLNVYGRSKADAEKGILDRHPGALVVRTSAFFGPWDEYNFVYQVIRQLSGRHPFAAADDVVVTPTYVPDLVNECLDLLLDAATGIWHVTNGEALSWAALAIKVAQRAGLDASLVQPLPQAAFGWPAVYPPNSALKSGRGATLPTLDSALDRYLDAAWPAEKRHALKAGFTATS